MALGVEQALLGMPVFGGTLTFTYQDGALRAGGTGSSTPNPDLLPASRRRRASPAPTR